SGSAAVRESPGAARRPGPRPPGLEGRGRRGHHPAALQRRAACDRRTPAVDAGPRRGPLPGPGVDRGPPHGSRADPRRDLARPSAEARGPRRDERHARAARRPRLPLAGRGAAPGWKDPDLFHLQGPAAALVAGISTVDRSPTALATVGPRVTTDEADRRADRRSTSAPWRAGPAGPSYGFVDPRPAPGAPWRCRPSSRRPTSGSRQPWRRWPSSGPSWRCVPSSPLT